MKKWGVLILLVGALLVAGCGKTATPAFESPLPTPAAGLPNPASQFCVDQGYELEIRTAGDGSQAGYCQFPDGSECDEWAYYRSECGPGTPKP